jgi:hypothetical protein
MPQCRHLESNEATVDLLARVTAGNSRVHSLIEPGRLRRQSLYLMTPAEGGGRVAAALAAVEFYRLPIYDMSVIRSFRDAETEKVFNGERRGSSTPSRGRRCASCFSCMRREAIRMPIREIKADTTLIVVVVRECSSLALQPWVGLLSERHAGYNPFDPADYDVTRVYSPVAHMKELASLLCRTAETSGYQLLAP